MTRLDADAAYLGHLGQHVTDIGQLWSFEVQQANGFSSFSELAGAIDAQVASPGLPLALGRSFAPSLIGRNETGPLGLGWRLSGGWQQKLVVESDGTVVIQYPGGRQRRFQPDSRGGYFDQPGDHATLTVLANHNYSLTEQDGLTTVFLAGAGQVASITDTNGNSIVAGMLDTRMVEV